jgi:hypothetical protein
MVKYFDEETGKKWRRVTDKKIYDRFWIVNACLLIKDITYIWIALIFMKIHWRSMMKCNEELKSVNILISKNSF